MLFAADEPTGIAEDPPALELVSASGDRFDLNALLSSPEGAQALAGLTGMGLPPVDVQWAVGAGDGARYRGKRVLPRDIDLPLFLQAASRQGLKALLRKLSLALAGECTLRMIEPDGTSWFTKVHRVGGGEYTYGVDTIGTSDMTIVVTLRAGDPFWTSERTSLGTFSTFDGTGLATGDVVNPGTVAVYPTWRIDGPGERLSVTGSGTSLLWDGYLLEDEYVTVDGRTGQITDHRGESRYHEMASTPSLPPFTPGDSDVEVKWPGMGFVPTRYNEARYPANFTGVPPGWSGLDAQLNLRVVGTDLRVGAFAGEFSADAITVGTYTLTGLPPNSWYWYSLDLHSVLSNVGSTTSLFEIYGMVDGVKTHVVASDAFRTGTVTRGSARLLVNADGTLPITVRFARTPTTTYTGGTGVTTYRWPDFALNQWLVSAGTSDYFDGASVDTASTNYSWEGAAFASRSLAAPLVAESRSKAKVSYSFAPREWMVV